MARFPLDAEKDEEILPWAKSVLAFLKGEQQNRQVDVRHPRRNSYRKRYHFQCEPLNKTQLKARHGEWSRISGGIRYDVAPGGDSDRDTTTTLTLTGTATNYVLLTLDSAVAPTSATWSISTTAPSDTDRTVKQVAHVDVSSGEFAGPIIQDWNGGNIEDIYIATDNDSVNYATDHELQVYDFDVASSEAITDYTNDLILFKDYGDGKMAYTTMEDFSASLIGYWDSIPAYPFAWSDLSDTSGDPTNPAADGYVPFVTGNLLTLVDGGPGGSGPWWKLGNTLLLDAYGAVVGRTAAIKAIDLTNMRLHYAGNEADTTQWTIDYNLTQMKSPVVGFWDILNGTYLKVSDTTVAAAGDGSIENAGGYYGANGAFILQGGSAQAGYFSDLTRITKLADTISAVDARSGSYLVNLVNTVTGVAGLFSDGTNACNIADNIYALNATAGNIHIQTGASYMVNAIQVLTDQQAAIADVATPPGSARDTTCRTKVNDILAMLRIHGIIAT
jgi:hypothetical protein